MTSFALVAEPCPAPRVAGLLTLVHAIAAVAPWVSRCPAAIALPASALAVAGFWINLARVPGAHGALRAVALEPGDCRARLTAGGGWEPAEVLPASRVSAGCVLLELRAGGRRRGWLLPRDCLPPAAFRRLKALIRLAW